MKAILKLKFKDDIIVRCFDVVSDELVYRYLDAVERCYGPCISRNIEFVPSTNEEEAFFNIRLKLFYNIVKIALDKYNNYYEDILFFDKIRLFTSLNTDKYIWLIGNNCSYMFNCDDISNYKNYVDYGLSANMKLYEVNIMQGTIEEIRSDVLC